MSSAVDMPSLSAKYAVHKAVFENDSKEVHQLLKARPSDVYLRDIHGNTPLHIAVMLNHTACINTLLLKDAPIKMKNTQGWTPLAEAISYGNRQTITTLLRRMKAQARESIHGKKSGIIEAMKKMPDFYLELKWDFHSWLPFVSAILPSDVCKIYKKGANIKLNTTLVNFNERTWERGDVSFICKCEADPEDRITIWDNKAKVYQKVRVLETDLEINNEVDMLMSGDVSSVQISTKILNFSRARVGWFFSQPKSELIGEYESDFYTIDNLYLETKKRREHLTAEDVRKNKAMFDVLKLGKFGDDEDFKQLQSVVRRKSVPVPPRSHATWEEYLIAAPGHPPCLGRPIILKQSAKHFKASVAMSSDFPLSLDSLLDILAIVAPFKHINKLRMFCRIKMPPGFPVRLDIPLLPTVSAKITFQKLEFREDLLDSLFEVPGSYREETNRFLNI